MLNAIADQIDIAHAHSLDIPGLIFSADLLMGASVPNVTTLHSAVDISNYSQFAACENSLVACSQNQAAACPDMNVTAVIHHGLDPAPFDFCRDSDAYVCFLGRMDRIKQPHLAIELALQKRLPIRLAGPISDGSPGRYFDRVIKPLLCRDGVEYFGVLGTKEKANLLGKASCNLHPTGFREPFGLTVIEAAFCGTPTLAIRRGALSEVVDQGVTGVLVEDYVEACYRLEECISLDRGANLPGLSSPIQSVKDGFRLCRRLPPGDPSRSRVVKLAKQATGLVNRGIQH